MSAILVVALVVLWWHFNKRIERLEEQARRSSTVETGSTVAPRPIPRADGGKQVKPLYADAWEPRTVEAAGPSVVDNFFEWLKKDFMVKLGAFLLLLAFSWFVSYAIMEEWIGPTGQIALGLLAGVCFLMLGVWRIESHRHQGSIFTVLGASIILFTLFAAQEVYDMFSSGLVLFMMFLTVVFVAFVSVRYKNEKLAHAGLLLGSAAPLFVGVTSLDVTTHFSYLLVVALGTLWVVWLTGWTRLILVSLAVTFLYSVAFMFDSVSSDRDVALSFTFAFVSLYFVANMVSLVRRHGEGVKHMAVHTFVALGTAIFLFTWIETAADPDWKGLLYAAWALIFAFGTYVVYSFTANRSAFYLYGATSAALIGLATASELDGPVLTLAYLFEICAALVTAGLMGLSVRTLARMSLLLVVPMLLSLESFASPLWRDGVFHDAFVVLVLTMGVLAAVGSLLHAKAAKLGDEVAVLTAQAGLSLAALYATSLVWLVLHALLLSDVATMFSLIVYTIVGITLFVSGTTQEVPWRRVAGGLFIGFVVLRLLFVEVWDMNLEGRIITFLVIGVLLISTAFLRKSQQTQEDSSIV